MNINTIWQAIGAIGVLLGIVNLLWTWLNASRQPTERKMAELECDVEDHGKRIAKVENDLIHMPTQGDLHGVKLQLSEMIGSMRVVETEMAATRRTLGRVETHLMNEKA